MLQRPCLISGWHSTLCFSNYNHNLPIISPLYHHFWTRLSHDHSWLKDHQITTISFISLSWFMSSFLLILQFLMVLWYSHNTPVASQCIGSIFCMTIGHIAITDSYDMQKTPNRIMSEWILTTPRRDVRVKEMLNRIPGTSWLWHDISYFQISELMCFSHIPLNKTVMLPWNPYVQHCSTVTLQHFPSKLVQTWRKNHPLTSILLRTLREGDGERHFLGINSTLLKWPI